MLTEQEIKRFKFLAGIISEEYNILSEIKIQSPNISPELLTQILRDKCKNQDAVYLALNDYLEDVKNNPPNHDEIFNFKDNNYDVIVNDFWKYYFGPFAKKFKKSKKLYNSPSKKTYDFGGSYPEKPGDPNWVVVDKISKENFIQDIEDEMEDDDEPNPYIQADLSKAIKLEPVGNVFSRQTVKYIPENKIKIFAENINNGLLPGGKVTLIEDYGNGYKANKLLFDYLINMGFKVIKSNLDEVDPKEEIIDLKIILQK